jgi:hypothetical protein
MIRSENLIVRDRNMKCLHLSNTGKYDNPKTAISQQLGVEKCIYLILNLRFIADFQKR